jgi:outer membrane protein TolC
MTDQEIKEALADLAMLWGDVEWWEEMQLSRVRPTLKAAYDAARQLQRERDEVRAELDQVKRQSIKSITLSWSGPPPSGGGILQNTEDDK